MGKSKGDGDRRPPADGVRPGGVTRRGFITSVGAGVAVTAAGSRLGAQLEDRDRRVQVAEPGEMAKVALTVNGRRHRLLVEPRWSLLFVLRERLGLTGTKVGCERGECGACTVLLGDVPRYSCLTLALEAQDQEITTVEGLMRGEELGPVQQAFVEHDAFQCGYCTPGQVVAAEGLLRADGDPSVDAVRLGMSGNLCRCGAYTHIQSAVRRAAELRAGKGGRS
ncbi:MAG: (2Fe-2S)-binding protein [Acidobacteriota bacterium]|jgi:xanthine dehydrogenase YagT iron-sulfur-binding subunit